MCDASMQTGNAGNNQNIADEYSGRRAYGEIRLETNDVNVIVVISPALPFTVLFYGNIIVLLA